MMRWFLVGVVALLATPVRADCPEGSRPPTAAEREFHGLKKKLPGVFPTQEGWAVRSQSDTGVPSSVCQGFDEGPLKLWYRCEWTREEGAEARAKAAEKVAGKVELTPAQKARIAELEGEMKKTQAKIKAAAEARRYDELEAHSVEVARISEAMQQVYAEPLADAERKVKEITKDTELEVSVALNESEYRGPGTPVRHAGIPLAVEKPSEEGVATGLFFGPWKLEEKDGRVTVRAAMDPKAPRHRVQSVVVWVRGDKARCARVIESARWGEIRALLGR